MEQNKDTTVKSKLGVEYTVTQDKAKELIDKVGCKWIGGKPIKEENPTLTANEVSELISKVSTLEDLKQYESDTRQVVQSAFKKKLTELSAK